MKYLFAMGIALLLISCKHDDSFNQKKWLMHQDVLEQNNPRFYMTEDLLRNYLKPGLTKDSIMALLGKPHKDGIERRLPKGLAVPDSIALASPANPYVENLDKALERFNAYMQQYSQPDTLMLYSVGLRIIDPMFLVVKLNADGLASEYWVEEH